MLTENQFLFLREAKLQLQHALNAFDAFETLRKDDAEPILQFKALDDFLHHSARANLIFWPVKRFKKRGEDLRALVKLDDASPLKTKSLRNSLQHLDERLEDWMSRPDSEISRADLCIDMNTVINGKRVFGLRELDSAETTYIFLGEKFPLLPMVEAARNLCDVISALPRHALGQL
jgi:hypothetical protein